MPAPFSGLLLSAWDELTALDGDSPLLAANGFEEGLLELPTSVADAPMWRKVIRLWREILHGIAHDQRTVTSWLDKVKAASEGRVGMDLLNPSNDFERALFCANAVRDPSTLGYAALYNGHYWGFLSTLVGCVGLGALGATCMDSCGWGGREPSTH